VGLLIELIGVFAVMSQARPNAAGWFPLSNEFVFSFGWAAVALGFVMWLIGQIVIHSARARR